MSINGYQFIVLCELYTSIEYFELAVESQNMN